MSKICKDIDEILGFKINMSGKQDVLELVLSVDKNTNTNSYMGFEIKTAYLRLDNNTCSANFKNEIIKKSNLSEKQADAALRIQKEWIKFRTATETILNNQGTDEITSISFNSFQEELDFAKCFNKKVTDKQELFNKLVSFLNLNKQAILEELAEELIGQQLPFVAEVNCDFCINEYEDLVITSVKCKANFSNYVSYTVEHDDLKDTYNRITLELFEYYKDRKVLELFSEVSKQLHTIMVENNLHEHYDFEKGCEYLILNSDIEKYKNYNPEVNRNDNCN